MKHVLVAAALSVLGLAVLAVPPAVAEDAQAQVVIKNHVFDPVEIKVPAGVRVVLTVDNQDPTPEEFESPELKIEKIIPGASRGKVQFGPLTAGSYLFYGDFHQKTARGVVTAE